MYRSAGLLKATLRALLAAVRPMRCSANALDATTTERARAPPQPLLMVTKCSVMIGGQLVSQRWQVRHPGPKSGSAGNSWRPQHTQKSRAARAMTPVLQDKSRHLIDLAELVPTNIWVIRLRLEIVRGAQEPSQRRDMKSAPLLPLCTLRHHLNPGHPCTLHDFGLIKA